MFICKNNTNVGCNQSDLKFSALSSNFYICNFVDRFQCLLSHRCLVCLHQSLHKLVKIQKAMKKRKMKKILKKVKFFKQILCFKNTFAQSTARWPGEYQTGRNRFYSKVSHLLERNFGFQKFGIAKTFPFWIFFTRIRIRRSIANLIGQTKLKG